MRCVNGTTREICPTRCLQALSVGSAVSDSRNLWRMRDTEIVVALVGTLVLTRVALAGIAQSPRRRTIDVNRRWSHIDAACRHRIDVDRPWRRRHIDRRRRGLDRKSVV